MPSGRRMRGGPAASWRPLRRQRCPPVGGGSRAPWRGRAARCPAGGGGGGGGGRVGGPGTCAPAAPRRAVPRRPTAGPGWGGPPCAALWPAGLRRGGARRRPRAQQRRWEEARRGRCLPAAIAAGCGVEVRPAESYRAPLRHGQPGRAGGLQPAGGRSARWGPGWSGCRTEALA